jgi:chromosomal replication initiation ATPase DnaA
MSGRQTPWNLRRRLRIGPLLRTTFRHIRTRAIGYQQIVQRVAVVFDVEVSTVKRGRRGEANQARKVAMYLGKRLCDLTLQETAGYFGVESYGVVGWACAQVRAKQAADRLFQKRVAQAEAFISQQTI